MPNCGTYFHWRFVNLQLIDRLTTKNTFYNPQRCLAFSAATHFKVPFFGSFIAFISLNRVFYLKKTAADQQPKIQALWDKIFLYRQERHKEYKCRCIFNTNKNMF